MCSAPGSTLGVRVRVALLALAGYALAVVAFTWPLSRHPSSRLMGPPGSDLGLYVWNLWVFQREAWSGHFPLLTTSILSLDSPVDLSLHNYTLFSDLIAVPFLPALGVVATYNLMCLANLVAGAFTMFLLARRVTGRASVAWLAGLLFGFSPTIIARATIHASLAAAAPLPLFALALLELDATRARRWAVTAGATLAWAAVCDPYYAIYCVVLTGWYFATKAARFDWGPWDWRGGGRAVRFLDGLILALGLVIAAIWVTGGVTLAIGPVLVGLKTLYTPTLVLTLCVLWRVWATLRLRVTLEPASEWIGLVRLAPYGAATATVLLSPILYALATRIADGRYVAAPVFWRTSTPGVDLTTFLMPNPNNVWLGAASRDWLSRQPGGYAENVASVTLAALVVIVAAMRFGRFAVPRSWGSLALGAASLTLGPFVHVAGANTAIPTPWAALRYVPLIGGARAPARFAVLVSLAVAVIFGLALKALMERYPDRRRAVLGLAGALVVLELFPAPRPMYDGRIPAIYDRIAADPRNVRVLELPFGVRDGLSSFGNFSASSQFYQTRHKKDLFGGYLSRVSPRRVEMVRRRPVLAALMALSEKRELSPAQAAKALARGPAFVRNTRLGYVVVNRRRASRELVDFAVCVLDLELVASSGGRDLYRPRAAMGPRPDSASASR